MSLDQHVSKVVFAARLLERALHDRGPWEMVWGDMQVPAVREISEETRTVTFSGTFPAACHLERPGLVYLLCGGEEVGVRPIEFPGDAAFTLHWRITGEAVEAAA